MTEDKAREHFLSSYNPKSEVSPELEVTQVAGCLWDSPQSTPAAAVKGLVMRSLKEVTEGVVPWGESAEVGRHQCSRERMRS